MKKIIKYLLISLVLMLPFMVNAKDKVEITKVTQGKVTGKAEVGKSTFSGLTVDFDVKFAEKDDSVVYNITITNNDTQDYELEKGELVNTSKHIKYYLDYDGSDIIKAKSTKEVTVKVTYYDLVKDSEFVNGRYDDSKQMKIELKNSETNKPVTKNPKTSTTGIIIALVLILLIASIVLIKANTKAKLLTVLTLTLLVPFATLAATKIQIIVNAKVEILALKDFCVLEDITYKTTTHKYLEGMTIESYCNSKYADIEGICYIKDNKNEITKEDISTYFANQDLVDCLTASVAKSNTKGTTTNCFTEHSNSIKSIIWKNDKISDKSKGCYVFTSGIKTDDDNTDNNGNSEPVN